MSALGTVSVVAAFAVAWCLLMTVAVVVALRLVDRAEERADLAEERADQAEKRADLAEGIVDAYRAEVDELANRVAAHRRCLRSVPDREDGR